MSRGRRRAGAVLSLAFAFAGGCGGGGASPAPASSPTSAAIATAPASTAAVTAAPAPTAAAVVTLSPSPSASPLVAAVVRGWKVNYAGSGSTMTGRHCGAEVGTWTIDGTYDRQGAKGVQRWQISIAGPSPTDPAARAGTYTYTDNAQLVQGPVTVTLEGKANGNVTLRRDSAGRAVMQFQETAHTYRTTIPGGGFGADQNAPLIAFDVTWEVDPTC